MEVQLTPEQEQQLSHLAALELGDRALDKGDYLTHEQVGANLQELFTAAV